VTGSREVLQALKRADRTSRPDLDLRILLHESWHRMRGFRSAIVGGAAVFTIFTLLSYLLTFLLGALLGDGTKSLFVSYAIYYIAETINLPILAGVIMLGVGRALDRPIRFADIFLHYNGPVLLLSVIFQVCSYGIFALLLSFGFEHFDAALAGILFLPLFALSLPLVAELKCSPPEALHISIGLFRRFPARLVVLYGILYLVHLAGVLTFIGFFWSAPFIVVANGMILRSLVFREKSFSTIAEKDAASKPGRPALRPDPANRPALRGTPLQNRLAILCIVLLLASAGVRLWAFAKKSAVGEPDHIATDGRSIAVHLDGSLFILNRDGTIEDRVELKDWDVRGKLADLEWLRDGSFLVGDYEMSRILRCRAGESPCVPLKLPELCTIGDYFKFSVDEERRLLYIADTNNHRLLVKDLDSPRCAPAETTSIVNYPNDIASTGDDRVVLSNTFHSQLLTFLPNETTAKEVGAPIRLGRRSPALPSSRIDDIRPGRDTPSRDRLRRDAKALVESAAFTRPLAVARGPGNHLWVITTDAFSDQSILRELDAEGTLVRLVETEKPIYPVDIIRFGNDLLAVDAANYRIYRISPDREDLEVFGAREFLRDLDAVREQVRTCSRIERLALNSVLFSLFGVLALLISIRRRSREA